MALEKILAEEFPENRVKVIKMHGSVNWKWEPKSWQDLQIILSNPADGSSFFKGLDVESNHSMYESKYPFRSYMIMPSFIKLFDNPVQLHLLNLAINKIEKAKEVYIIGYSLPPADVTSNFLFSKIPKNAKIYLINQKTKDLSDRIISCFNIDPDNIIDENSDIISWINNGFKFVEYKRRKSELKKYKKIFSDWEDSF